MGSGKSLTLVYLSRYLKKKYPSYRLVSNLHIKDVEYITTEQLFKLEHKTFYLIDEPYHFLNSIAWFDGISILASEILSKTRKYDSRFYFTLHYGFLMPRRIRQNFVGLIFPQYNKKLKKLELMFIDYKDDYLIYEPQFQADKIINAKSLLNLYNTREVVEWDISKLVEIIRKLFLEKYPDEKIRCFMLKQYHFSKEFIELLEFDCDKFKKKKRK